MALTTETPRPPVAATAADLLQEVRTDADAAEYLRLILAARSGRPLWLPGTQELWWRGRIVKRLRRDAANQTPVLEAFQREGWPPVITDPLPAVHGRNKKSCRRNTAKGLNKGLAAGTFRFHSEGTGRIRWEVHA